MTKSQDPPQDLNALAKQYLDLWQQQLGGISKDEQTADVMARTMELMNAGAATFSTMAAAATLNAGVDTHEPKPTSRTKPRTNPQATAPSPGDTDDDLAELSRRLERLEKRIAALEAGPKKSRRKPAKKTRKS